jgi:hypothetical protein
MLFAGSHYTALIRVFHALGKYRAILRCCHEFGDGNRSLEPLLGVHDAVAGFWEHIGSAIDNLALCFKDAPCLALGEREGSKYLQKRYAFLDHCYDRRTQLIHSRLIPKGLDGGICYFNVRLLERKSSDWREQFERREIVEDHYTDHWHRFLGEIGDAWEHLRNWLRNEDKGRPVFEALQAPDFDPDKQSRILTNSWGHGEAPSTIRMTDPRDVIRTEEVKPFPFPDVPPSGTRS